MKKGVGFFVIVSLISIVLLVGASLLYFDDVSLSGDAIFSGKLFQKPATLKPYSGTSKIFRKCDFVSILNYPSLSQVKTDLQTLILYNEKGGTITGYELVLSLLNDYNGYANNSIKEAFFDSKWAIYAPTIDSYGNRIKKGYVIRVVHSLWLECNKIVPWSLKDYSQSEIQALFWINDLWGTSKPFTTLGRNDYSKEYYAVHSIEVVESSYKLFLLAQKLRQTNQYNSILSLIKWQKKNFFHAYYDYGWERYADGREDYSGVSRFPPASLELALSY